MWKFGRPCATGICERLLPRILDKCEFRLEWYFSEFNVFGPQWSASQCFWVDSLPLLKHVPCLSFQKMPIDFAVYCIKSPSNIEFTCCVWLNYFWKPWEVWPSIYSIILHSLECLHLAHGFLFLPKQLVRMIYHDKKRKKGMDRVHKMIKAVISTAIPQDRFCHQNYFLCVSK